MATVLYVNPDPATQGRATALGCGWMPQVPDQFPTATAPCVIVAGQGAVTVLPEPTTAAAVTSALAPILAAEQAAASTAATQAANLVTLQARAQAALDTNVTYLAIASPSTAQNTAQIKALTKECSAAIRLLLSQLDSLAGT